MRWARFGEAQCRAEGPSQSLRIHMLQAEALTDLGDYQSALTALHSDPPQAHEVARRRSRYLRDQAWVYFYLGNYELVGKLLEDAENQAKDIVPADPAALSEIIIAKLTLFGKTLDLEAARRTMDELDRMSNVVDRAHLLAAYGYVLERSAHYEEAAKYYESALFETGVTPLDAGRFQNNLADIYYHLGNLDQALTVALQAESVLEKAGDQSGLRICLNTLGLIYSDKGEHTQGKQYLAQALTIAETLHEKRAITEVENNLAALAIDENDGGKAEELNSRAFENEGETDRESRQYSQIAKARILAGRRDFPDALTALDEVRDTKLENPNPRIDAEVEYIDIYRQLRDETHARAHYGHARVLIDHVRSTMREDENKLAWFDSQNQLNQAWVRFLVESGHGEEALEAAESSRARLMLERLNRKGRPTGQVSAYRSLARSEGAALVAYWLTPDVSYAWVITADKVQLQTLPDERTIAAMVSRYRSFIEDGNDPLASTNAAASDLVKAVLAPLLPLLGNAKSVILVPDAELSALNFETLPVNGHYWIKSITLTVAPALDILDADQKPENHAASAQPSILAIGDPAPTAEFQKLPSASRELDSVAHTFPVNAVLRGAAATPAAYFAAADGASYIHFAAHASAIAGRPLDSAVILSSGRLTARDLLQNPIHAELVTISACRSAGVRSYHGEGLVGLAWVFLQTGAHGVIAGLWDASDDATADLMIGLYRRISQGEAPAGALRAAKLEMLDSNSHFAIPYYWGAFQYYRGTSH